MTAELRTQPGEAATRRAVYARALCLPVTPVTHDILCHCAEDLLDMSTWMGTRALIRANGWQTNTEALAVLRSAQARALLS